MESTDTLANMQLFDVILCKMFQSLESIILRYREEDSQNVGHFIEKIIELCLQNDKIKSIDDIFKNFAKNVNLTEEGIADEKSMLFLYCCFIFMSRALSYLSDSRDIVVSLTIKSIGIRCLLTEDTFLLKCN